jgi:1,4-dihydroxy-2-naphthoate octaprenyltransferase
MLCLVLALFVAIGWAVVWALFTMIFIPIAYKAVQFYKDHDCADMVEFFEELLEEQSDGSIIEQ